MTSRVAFRQERIDPDAIFAGAPEPAPLPRPLPSTALRTGDSVVPQRRSTAVEFPLEDDDDDDDYDAADDDNYEAADDDDHEAADDDDYEAADDDDYEAADDDDYDPADDDDYEAADDDDYDTADDDDYDTADDDDYEVVARAGSGVGTSVGISSGGDGASLVLPTVDLLEEMPTGNTESDDERNDRLRHSARQLEHVFADYSIKGRIIRALPGPVVTLFELDPAPGIKASKIINLSDDVARAMRADNVRISVVRGSTVMGVELPNDLRETVALRDILADEEFHTTEANLPLVLGRNISGEPVIVDLATMPHLLIAGSTGTGKSVGLNAMILSLIFRHPPSRCRFVMIDPKMLELSVYADIPHLLTPVVTEHEKAVFALRWVVREMERRYKVMAQTGVRNIAGYNARLQRGELPPDLALDDEPFPFVVVVVDEMADLMKVAGKDVEILIQRLAQMARAAGIHIIMATQRPSVDVVTGTIKANFPTRISYTVTSRIDSRTILGEQGAETLLGRGDMLYMSGGAKIDRVHGPFVTDEDVGRVCDHLRAQATAQYVEGVTEEERRVVAEAMNPTEDADLIIGHDNDELLYDRAVMVVRRDKRASISFVQRQLQIGYNRAARMIEQMEAEGIVTSPSHTGKREVID
ncbi:MAG: DNA translocase FtsK [Alphaproteobacteria bacterium]|nr:DNA translocase FtsK [Alphaproteobacteria bacterium]